MDAKDQLRLDVGDAGPEFFSDEVAISHGPTKFILDFKSITPRMDVPGQPPRQMLKHNVVKMDPYLAKEFHDVLKQNIDKYEKKFGKIEKPKQLEKAEKDAKKKGKEKKQDYFG